MKCVVCKQTYYYANEYEPSETCACGWEAQQLRGDYRRIYLSWILIRLANALFSIGGWLYETARYKQMPYIGKEKRQLIDGLIQELADVISGAGMLNYAITRLSLLSHLHVDGYQRVAEIIGVLENIKLEFFRRKVVPYAEKKITENGDVSEYARPDPVRH